MIKSPSSHWNTFLHWNEYKRNSKLGYVYFQNAFTGILRTFLLVSLACDTLYRNHGDQLFSHHALKVKKGECWQYETEQYSLQVLLSLDFIKSIC
jgi:hypothetical protein